MQILEVFLTQYVFKSSLTVQF